MWEGVRIDEELARKASVAHTIASANLAPSAKMEEVRHRRGHRLESGCRFHLSWVRFPLLPPFSMPHRFAMLSTKFLWPSRVCSVNERFRRADITWCRAAKAEPRSCRRVIQARISFTRPGVITSFGIRSIQSNPSWPTLVSRNFSGGYINSMKLQFSEVNVVEVASQESTDSFRF